MEIEKIIIERILSKVYVEKLPSERRLSTEFHISRQKIREILQKLEFEGWIQTHHGKATTINPYWEEGGLNLLNSLIQHQILHLPGMDQNQFLIYLLEVRFGLAPLYTKDALERNSNAIALFLEKGLNKENLKILRSSSSEITIFDWEFHKLLCKTALNKMFLFMLNSFRDIYLTYGNLYFSLEFARERSLLFYHEFYKNLKKNKINKAILEIKKVTKESIDILKMAFNKYNPT
ncbi:MAG: GntR family transcriptional regulator [Leptonema sp. (in: bacteria)]